MRYGFDWIDFGLNCLLWLCGIVLALFLIALPFAVKDSMEFRERCEAKHGTTITGRDIRLCVVDGKIVDGN
jgi:hypothetical protein